jgi:hypothetical protein
MVILLPFMIPIMIGLKLTGEHYIFYLQPRVGKGGRDFDVFKFATMLKNSPNLPGGVLTQKNDPRILPMGRFLRKTKINELPQLANILIGQMSVVGPRPQARRHYELYSLPVRAEIDKVPPGLTGIGSVVFRDEEAILDEVPATRDRFHDNDYRFPFQRRTSKVWWTQAPPTSRNYYQTHFPHCLGAVSRPYQLGRSGSPRIWPSTAAALAKLSLKKSARIYILYHMEYNYH